MKTLASFVCKEYHSLVQSGKDFSFEMSQLFLFPRFSCRCSCYIAGCYSSCWVRFVKGLLARCRKWTRLGVYWASSTCYPGQWIFLSSVSFISVQRFASLDALTGENLFPASFRLWNPKWRKINLEFLDKEFQGKLWEKGSHRGFCGLWN